MEITDKGSHCLQREGIFLQTMTAFVLFKVRGLNSRLKASIPLLYVNSNEFYKRRHFESFTAALVQLKKPAGGPKGLIGPPCHGVNRVPGYRCQWCRCLH
jgi:hypothetical protein